MRKLLLFVSILMLLGLTQAPAAGADSSWVGLWKMDLEGRNKDSAFLVISESAGKVSVQYYSHDWTLQSLRYSSVENGKLVFQSIPLARTYKFELSPSGAGKAEGVWALQHPQAKITGTLHASRIFADKNWDPIDGLQELEKPSHIVDLNAYLYEKAPLGSLEKFTAFWDSQFEPKFYTVIEETLYRNPLPDRAAAIKSTYELLKQSSYRELSVRAAREMEKIISDIKVKDVSLYREAPMVLMPSLGRLEASSDYVCGRLFVRLGVDLIARRHPGKGFSCFLAKEQLKLPFQQLFSVVDERLGVVFMREGLASYLAVASGFGPSADVCLGLPEGTYAANGDKINAYRAVVLKSLEVREPSDVVNVLTGPNNSKLGLMVAYKFGEQVGKRFKPDQLYNMGAVQVKKLLRAYLQEGT